MIPVLTATAARLGSAELRALSVLEEAAQLAPSAALAAAELACVVPLWSRLALAWTPTDLAASGGVVMRRLVPWVSGGLLPRTRLPGESPEAYAAALDAASLRLTAHPDAAAIRAAGKLVRRFARTPDVARLLSAPDVAAAGILGSRGWPALAAVVRLAAAGEPRLPSSTMTEAGEIDWDAENARARAERKAAEASARVGYAKRSAAAASAYASACAAFPALLVAAPAVAAALALGVVAFEGFLTVSRLLGSSDANSKEEIARVAKELRYFTDRGIPPLVFDGALWSARGFADTLGKVAARIEGFPADVRSSIYDLGATIRAVGSTSAVANAAVDALSKGPAGYGPIWPAVVFKSMPAAQTIAERMGVAIATILACEYEQKGFMSPEAKMRAAAVDAYKATLLDKSVSLDDTYGFALARSWDAAVTAARTNLVPLPKLLKLDPRAILPPSSSSSSDSSAAPLALGLGLLLLFL